MAYRATVAALVAASHLTFGFVVPTTRHLHPKVLHSAEDSGEAADLGDWRDFRARLIAQESGGSAKTLGGSWAYETTLVEKGSVILGGTQSSYGFDLHQQYFHKSVILVLEHNEEFTKGVIINRPSPLRVATPEMSSGSTDCWEVWFGGDVQGLTEGNPMLRETNCLHCLPENGDSSPQVAKVSVPLGLGSLRYTTSGEARELVQKKLAKASDFWTFTGYCGWGPGQLQKELDRDSWHLAATGADVILKKGMRGGGEDDDAAAAGKEDVCGVGVWAELMQAIGRGDDAKATEGCLADDMLLEWAHETLGVPLPADGEDDLARVEDKDKDGNGVGVVAGESGVAVGAPGDDDGQGGDGG
eukprot:CAMPEP_0171910280 /NCGR_PEP_ID=MMETSP0993-20121228/9274_1 /TAXON_ID=483369 /ORGANISM="non described non described, Strain CCMP2098" /LENGTH=357 /DNA_ID=CAMNT_0012543413 /DNA_START=51 /DNA_END=1120 /DNA_ORIENTATION=-